LIYSYTQHTKRVTRFDLFLHPTHKMGQNRMKTDYTMSQMLLKWVWATFDLINNDKLQIVTFFEWLKNKFNSETLNIQNGTPDGVHLCFLIVLCVFLSDGNLEKSSWEIGCVFLWKWWKWFLWSFI